MNTKMLDNLFKLGTLSAIIAMAVPELAVAQTDVNDTVRTFAQNQLPVFPYILTAVCYVGGAFMMVSGALSLKKHAENPGGEPMAKGIARLLTGGAITAVPTLTSILQQSVWGGTITQADFRTFNQTFQ